MSTNIEKKKEEKEKVEKRAKRFENE